MKTQAVVIGKGPAGIQAALYLIRANINTVIIGKDYGALEKADMIENYYGFSEPIAANELLKQSEKNAQRLGGKIINDTVVALKYSDSGFCVETASESIDCSAIIISTGTARKKPSINGLNEFEGKGVSYCATCDAFFYRGKNVAVLGNGDYALHEAAELLPSAATVTVLLNGKELDVETDKRFIYNKKSIKAITGADKIENIVFTDKSDLKIDGLFIAEGTASSTELAQKLGVLTKNNSIITDEFMQTNVPGVFAAGDCTGGLLQISKAVGEGAVAGTSAVKYIRQSKEQ